MRVLSMIGRDEGQEMNTKQFGRLRRFTRLSHIFPLEKHTRTFLGSCRHPRAERNQAPTFVNVWGAGCRRSWEREAKGG
jgi:hypothetical protein